MQQCTDFDIWTIQREQHTYSTHHSCHHSRRASFMDTWCTHLWQVKGSRQHNARRQVAPFSPRGQLRVVPPHRLPTDHHRIRQRARFKDQGARLGARDPCRVASLRCDLAVERHGVLEHAQRALGGSSVQQGLYRTSC